MNRNYESPEIKKVIEPFITNLQANKQHYQYDNFGKPHAVYNLEQQPNQQSVQPAFNGESFNLNRNNESPEIKKVNEPLNSNQQVNTQNHQLDNFGQPDAVFNVEQQSNQQSVKPVFNEVNSNLNRNNESPEIKKVNELQVPNNNCIVTSNVNSNRTRIEGLPIDDEDCEGDIGNRINPNALKSLIG